MKWPNRIRELRAKRGLTQTALAALVGMTQPGLARLESGRQTPSVVTAARLRKALGCSIDDPLEA